ncbi:MAG TPA: DUF4038 domain-containing protein [Chloroflexota bacterium]|nr:DUF4038 domain-containing protein [Chloroflexota bacterium]
MLYATRNCPIEWSYNSGKFYPDPFNALELDLHLTAPDGSQLTVPAFWGGDQIWRVRFAPRQVGQYHFRTTCSDAANADLHDQTGALTVTEYGGNNPLLRHGPLRVNASRRYLEHQDGTPFFWLGDTWWMGLCRRLSWPDEFRTLLADRVEKGYTVVQIVAGLYPDMPAFDERGANEAGFPWETDYTRINPAYFDQADLRIAELVRAGIVPCLVGCWGYFIGWLGVEGMMPFYLSEDPNGDREFQRRAWTELAAHVKSIDPDHHPITIHPTSPAASRDQLVTAEHLDLDLLQTGHGDRLSLAPTIETARRAVAAEPRLPVVNSEVCYEGIAEANRQEVQRLMFWASVLSGACGHTYGANGIWQLNSRQQPYGPSPHGFSWGDVPWEDAYRLPGSAQVALGKQLLEDYPWWRFEPHPEWVEPGARADDYHLPYAAGIADEVRIVYFPQATGFRWGRERFRLVGLAPDPSYRAFFWDPKNARRYPIDRVEVDASGTWVIPHPPLFQDWVLVLEMGGLARG